MKCIYCEVELEQVPIGPDHTITECLGCGRWWVNYDEGKELEKKKYKELNKL